MGSWLVMMVALVAGPREEKRPGVYACVAALLDVCLAVEGAAVEAATDTHY